MMEHIWSRFQAGNRADPSRQGPDPAARPLLQECHSRVAVGSHRLAHRTGYVSL